MSPKLIDRGRLKEINHRLLLGHNRHPGELKPLVDSFAERRCAQHPSRRARGDRARQGRRAARGDGDRQLPLLRAEIAERLGFDDCIGTNSILGLDERVHAKIDGENCYGPAKLRMIRTGSRKAAWSAAMSASIPTMPATRRCSNGPTSRSR